MAAQIAAVLIFLVMFLLIIMDKIERHIITLGCAVVTMVVVFGICMHSMTALTETLNVAQIFTRGFWYTAGEASESSAGSLLHSCLCLRYWQCSLIVLQLSCSWQQLHWNLLICWTLTRCRWFWQRSSARTLEDQQLCAEIRRTSLSEHLCS